MLLRVYVDVSVESNVFFTVARRSQERVERSLSSPRRAIDFHAVARGEQNDLVELTLCAQMATLLEES
jgi:hypothetical protein